MHVAVSVAPEYRHSRGRLRVNVHTGIQEVCGRRLLCGGGTMTCLKGFNNNTVIQDLKMFPVKAPDVGLVTFCPMDPENFSVSRDLVVMFALGVGAAVDRPGADGGVCVLSRFSVVNSV
ncbi:unnamed protein product [Pleuronectes platessa]|uniref:Uncharacterized protein n=1 Tax=Pleuronectes platessa TaxID=8262 RepID=A0A9N7UXT7_PLEPL|nr:unnamed protein product [Pleuronectes platessa]